MRRSARHNFLVIHFLVRLDQVYLNLRRTINSLRANQNSKNHLKMLHLRFGNTDPAKKIDDCNQKMIILDYFPFPHWLSVSSLAARIIQEKTSGTIFAFGFVKPFKNAKNLYHAFGVENHLQIKLDIRQTYRLWKSYKKSVSSISSPEDVFNLEIDGIQIGIPVYETILRSGRITVSIDDVGTYKQIYRGLMQFLYFEQLFSNDKIEAILVSHDCYIGPGLLDRMAHRYGILSINVNPFEINLPFKPAQLYKRFERYPEYFAALSKEARIAGLELARKDLDLRLSGVIGIKMGYQEQSAFESNVLSNQLVKSENLKVLVATHDFYDNPQGYGQMLFNDFSIWLEFLNEVSSGTTYDWYLKCHKDSSLEQRQEIEKFAQKNSRFKIVEPSVSFHQLAQEGLDFVLTCYGSVGHELPFLGVHVLNSSFNPHIAYSFNHHAKSRDNYRKMILDLSELKKKKLVEREVYEFFYVHHYMMWPDDFIFPSFSEYLEHVNNRIQSDKSISYILSNFETIEKKLRMQLLEALKERRVFSVERNLEPKYQSRHPITPKNRVFFEKFAN